MPGFLLSKRRVDLFGAERTSDCILGDFTNLTRSVKSNLGKRKILDYPDEAFFMDVLDRFGVGSGLALADAGLVGKRADNNDKNKNGLNATHISKLYALFYYSVS